MKNTLLTLAALLLLASAAQAKKTIVEFYPGVEGYVSSPNIQWRPFNEVYTNETGEVSYLSGIEFSNSAEKDSITFTKIAPEGAYERFSIYLLSPFKSVNYKGADLAILYGLFAVRDNLTVKMKNANFQLIYTGSLKSVQVEGFINMLQPVPYEKGTVVKVSGMIGGDDSTGILLGCYKSLTADIFGSINAANVYAPKVLSLKAKNLGGTVFLNPAVKYKAKNVNVAPAE